MTASDATLSSIRNRFAFYRGLAERALEQIGDAAFFASVGDLDPPAVIVKHIAGNFRSRWTDFLTSDGNKPDRNRDSEFVIETRDTRSAITERWAEGWRLLDVALESLTADGTRSDVALVKSVAIRAEPHLVVDALERALTHTAYHVGQIVLLSKLAAGDQWETLSITRGGSAAFEAEMIGRQNARQT